MGLLNRLSDGSKSFLNEVLNPESFAKGDKFEAYIRNSLITKDKYILLQKTHDYATNKNDYIEDTKEPDYKFKSIKGGIEFFVEAKYRSFLGAGQQNTPFVGPELHNSVCYLQLTRLKRTEFVCITDIC